MEYYRHTQTGCVVIISFLIALALSAYPLLSKRLDWVLPGLLIFIGILTALFASLTVIIHQDTLEIRFGIGIIKKRFQLRDIESCRIVKNPWYSGWGIHRTSTGWLYNVSGFHAVEIRMKSGDRHRIGTDVPDELDKAIKYSIERTRNEHDHK